MVKPLPHMYGNPQFLLRLLVVGMLVLSGGSVAGQADSTTVAVVSASSSGSHHVLIEWTTMGEYNNDYFVVERSFDGVNFEEVGRLTGQGSKNIRHDYNFFDYRGAIDHTRYYRLRQVAFGGDEAQTRVYVVPALLVPALPLLAVTGVVEPQAGATSGHTMDW